MKTATVALNLAWLLLVAALAFGWFYDHTARQRSGFLLPAEDQKTLHRDDQQEIWVTTHRKPGLFGRQIFQVWARPTVGDVQWQALLTLENSQDAPVGPPTTIQKPDGIVVSDERGSFEFDLIEKSFIKNDWPDAVYSGPARCCLPPQ